MNYKLINIGLVLAGAVLFLAALMIPANWQDAQAAPPAVPTPVMAPNNSGDGSFFRFQPETALAGDTNTPAIEVMAFDKLDIEYIIDQTDINTVALTVQYSNHGLAAGTWTDGAALVAANAADGTVLVVDVPVWGRYMRINQNATNTNTFTSTITAVGR